MCHYLFHFLIPLHAAGITYVDQGQVNSHDQDIEVNTMEKLRNTLEIVTLDPSHPLTGANHKTPFGVIMPYITNFASGHRSQYLLHCRYLKKEPQKSHCSLPGSKISFTETPQDGRSEWDFYQILRDPYELIAKIPTKISFGQECMGNTINLGTKINCPVFRRAGPAGAGIYAKVTRKFGNAFQWVAKALYARSTASTYNFLININKDNEQHYDVLFFIPWQKQTATENAANTIFAFQNFLKPGAINTLKIQSYTNGTTKEAIQLAGAAVIAAAAAQVTNVPNDGEALDGDTTVDGEVTETGELPETGPTPGGAGLTEVAEMHGEVEMGLLDLDFEF